MACASARSSAEGYFQALFDPDRTTTPLRRHIPAGSYADHLCAYAHTVCFDRYAYMHLITEAIVMLNGAPARTERRIHYGWIVAAVTFATLLTSACAIYTPAL